MMLTPLLGVGLFAQTFGLTAAAMMRILEHNAVRADLPRRSQAPERTIRGLTFWAGTISVDAVCFSVKAKVGSMTDEQLAAMHRLLAEYHRRLAKEALLDIVQQYHSDLAQRLSDEAVLIPRRTAIAERLREREQVQEKDDSE